MCSDVFDNQKGCPLKKLKLPIPIKEEYDENQTLSSIINKPTWYGFDDENGEFVRESKQPFKPDILTIQQKGDDFEFIILDAKYYNLKLEYDSEKLEGNPEIESITKQYMYELSFKKFIKDHKFSKTKNCFLFPTEKDEIINKGYVNLNFSDDVALENIQLILLPAHLINEYFLSGKTLDISCLKLKDFEKNEGDMDEMKIKKQELFEQYKEIQKICIQNGELIPILIESIHIPKEYKLSPEEADEINENDEDRIERYHQHSEIEYEIIKRNLMMKFFLNAFNNKINFYF